MNIRKVNQLLSVSGPLTQDELKQLARSGVKSLVNCRPDNEEPGQVPDAVLRIQASNAGLNYYFVPVKSGDYSPQAVAEFGHILLSAPEPVHAMCRTGTRVVHLWALAKLVQGVAVADIIQTGKNIGVALETVITEYQSCFQKSLDVH
ncbi:TIGR01244 family sulfur transferase [Alteromonas lipolytica]|uniref:TIGR01244 family protein n=1 Tax=Alteromonas lipolytica TaxID=1856405 RepID=A0A1E8FCB7_9ALTE|nr:TIGR01244 family sulfur transferase [Alteromonas lipolytica]OFI33143.1 TIGR01244 family protein [Alteromonas lipolytica]GGF62106.1 pyridine nucleotide-disulfide oxidoreductase [Alteromonas lipolytica]